MSEDTRTTMTGCLWVVSALALGALFISAAAQAALTGGHVALAFVILALAVSGTLFFLRGNLSELEQEKAKRQRRDKLLGDMTDDDLLELKRRLASVDNSSDMDRLYLDDDGELVRRR